MTENVLEVQVRAPEELREGRKATQVVPEALSLVVSLGTPLLDELADPKSLPKATERGIPTKSGKKRSTKPYI